MKQTKIPVILHIETGGDNCSVAISEGDTIKGIKESYENKEHSKLLSVFIDELLREMNLDYTNIDAVSISKGPGSYTGLRIGTATAKGICYGLNIPLISVDSLLSMTYVCTTIKDNRIYCPMIDARRQEVYTALFNSKFERLSPTSAMIVTSDSFYDILEKKEVIFFGSGSNKCKSIIKHPNAYFTEVQSSAKGLVIPAYNAFAENKFENIAYFEPLYLKDFVATTKKK